MSQEISTVLTSCGLMVGLNMAPPPPGPMTLKSPGRSADALDKQGRQKLVRTRIAGKTLNFIGSSLSLTADSCSGSACSRDFPEVIGRWPPHHYCPVITAANVLERCSF